MAINPNILKDFDGFRFHRSKEKSGQGEYRTESPTTQHSLSLPDAGVPARVHAELCKGWHSPGTIPLDF